MKHSNKQFTKKQTKQQHTNTQQNKLPITNDNNKHMYIITHRHTTTKKRKHTHNTHTHNTHTQHTTLGDHKNNNTTRKNKENEHNNI